MVKVVRVVQVVEGVIVLLQEVEILLQQAHHKEILEVQELL